MYNSLWQPVVGEMLILRKEPTKSWLFVSRKKGRLWDMFLRIWLCCFLDRDVNKGFAEVTAVPLNLGACMGMERLYGKS